MLVLLCFLCMGYTDVAHASPLSAKTRIPQHLMIYSLVIAARGSSISYKLKVLRHLYNRCQGQTDTREQTHEQIGCSQHVQAINAWLALPV